VLIGYMRVSTGDQSLDPTNAAHEIAEQLGISLSTLYAYVDGHGAPKARARKLLGVTD
jgi:hypothetical protein